MHETLKIFICLLSLLVVQPWAIAQNETRNWCFGYGHHIYFDTNSVQILPTSSTRGEPAASISDSSGNLLFYTNGGSIWNKLNHVMENGGGLVGSFSATQCLIVKQPLSNTLYYVFYTDGWGGNEGANYAIVDMSLNDGLGSVISKNNLLFTPASEKFSAVKHANDTSIWVMTRTVKPPVFKAYALTKKGLNPRPVISYDNTTDTTGIGQMKFSHNGSKLALGISDMHCFEILDFDASTGILSNPYLSPPFPTRGTYGVEFSPNDSILYCTRNSERAIFKYDLRVSGNPLLNHTLMASSGSPGIGQLQLAIDGNIYVGREESNYLGAIHNPNSWTMANYVDNGLNLQKRSNWSLPNFDQSLLKNVLTEIATSVSAINNQNYFTVFPNPFNQEINIEASFEFSEITVRDIYGRVVFQKQLNNANKLNTDLNEVPNGNYFVAISSKENLRSVLVVKN